MKSAWRAGNSNESLVNILAFRYSHWMRLRLFSPIGDLSHQIPKSGFAAMTIIAIARAARETVLAFRFRQVRLFCLAGIDLLKELLGSA
jgi:hypothetical protein